MTIHGFDDGVLTVPGGLTTTSFGQRSLVLDRLWIVYDCGFNLRFHSFPYVVDDSSEGDRNLRQEDVPDPTMTLVSK